MRHSSVVARLFQLSILQQPSIYFLCSCRFSKHSIHLSACVASIAVWRTIPSGGHSLRLEVDRSTNVNKAPPMPACSKLDSEDYSGLGASDYRQTTKRKREERAAQRLGPTSSSSSVEASCHQHDQHQCHNRQDSSKTLSISLTFQKHRKTRGEHQRPATLVHAKASRP